MQIRYRVWQTWHFFTGPPLDEAAWTAVRSKLTPAELTLFQRYRPSDRRHAYRVMCALQATGHAEPTLLSAALLHDIGKTRLPLSIAERVLVVVGCKLFPGRASKWGMGEPAGWRRAFVIKAQHAQWGAEMATLAGSDPRVVELIRRHQDTLTPQPAGTSGRDDDRLLRLLQWADDRS